MHRPFGQKTLLLAGLLALLAAAVLVPSLAPDNPGGIFTGPALTAVIDVDVKVMGKTSWWR